MKSTARGFLIAGIVYSAILIVFLTFVFGFCAYYTINVKEFFELYNQLKQSHQSSSSSSSSYSGSGSSSAGNGVMLIGIAAILSIAMFAYVAVAQMALVFFALISLVLIAFSIVLIVNSAKAINTQRRGQLITCIVFSALSLNVFSLVGAIIGLNALKQEQPVVVKED